MADQQRDKKTGRWLGGHVGLGGRPRGMNAVTREIMAKSNDGAALVAWVWKIWEDESQPWSRRWAAFQWLSDHGPGKPVNTTEINASITASTVPPEVEALDVHDRVAWLEANALRLLGEGEP